MPAALLSDTTISDELPPATMAMFALLFAKLLAVL